MNVVYKAKKKKNISNVSDLEREKVFKYTFLSGTSRKYTINDSSFDSVKLVFLLLDQKNPNKNLMT